MKTYECNACYTDYCTGEECDPCTTTMPNFCEAPFRCHVMENVEAEWCLVRRRPQKTKVIAKKATNSRKPK